MKEERREERRVQREEARSIIALVIESKGCQQQGTNVSGLARFHEVFISTGMAYRSMMAMKGETSPEAHAAAVKSDVTLHGRSFVFQHSTFGGSLDVGSERARGEARWALSAKAFPRPSRSMLRVIV